MNEDSQSMEEEVLFSSTEVNVLQAVMNSALGEAAADLAEFISIHVVLSVPEINVLSARDFPNYLKAEAMTYSRVNIIEQNFWGDFKGSAFLVLPGSAGKVLVKLLGNDSLCNQAGIDSFDNLERETLVEFGNILIGACVAKISNLLGNSVMYSPPSLVVENGFSEAIGHDLFDPSYSAVLLKTLFHFTQRDVSGFLFLVTTDDSIDWIKEALAKFMERYE